MRFIKRKLPKSDISHATT